MKMSITVEVPSVHGRYTVQILLKRTETFVQQMDGGLIKCHQLK